LLCSKRYRGRCEWLIKDDEMLWRKGSYGVCSHRGELFRQRILSLVETAKRLGRCPQEWLRAIVKACIEKTDYPIPAELCASSPCR
ncbi:IS66 family transposase, partial [Aeromonas cavernicola]